MAAAAEEAANKLLNDGGSFHVLHGMLRIQLWTQDVVTRLDLEVVWKFVSAH